MSRKSKNKPLKEKVAIFVEGPTEKNYLVQIKQDYNFSNASIIKVFSGQGDYVDKAESKCKELSKKYSLKNKVLFFDTNHKNQDEINSLLKKAEDKKYQVAFSNTCFEVWLLGHFEPMTQSLISEKNLINKLNGHLKKPYEKANANQLALIASNFNNAIENTSSIVSYSYEFQSTNVGEIIKKLIL